MTVFSFSDLFNWAREKSPFYQELYKNLSSTTKIEDLPLLNSTQFWAANNIEDNFKNNRILTAPLTEGIAFKSGGTTGNPKFSFFTKEEWETFTQSFGEGMTQGGLKDGERIANLFYAGDLYSSFLFIMKAIEASPRKVLHIPLSGSAEMDHILKTLQAFQVDVWAGVPTTIMKVAEAAKKGNIFPPKKILFGGENFYPDQRLRLSHIFPGIQVQSIGYASVDGGLLGYVDENCAPQEHRVFSKYTIIEIIDEDTGLPILDIGKVGKIILTNLTRKLMPIIRYPVGDRGEWIEPLAMKEDRKFKILGRSEEGARVGPATVYFDDIALFLHSYQTELDSAGFQLVLRHFDEKDQLVVRIATNCSQNSHLKTEIAAAIARERPLLKELMDKKMIHKVLFEFVKTEQLVFQERTGKLRRIIDERF